MAENRYTSSTSEAAAEIEATPDCDIRDDALQDIKIKKKTPKEKAIFQFLYICWSTILM